MRLLQKGIALAVIVSLIGQNLLWAAPTDDKKVPLSTVQEQARQDQTWLQRNGLTTILVSYSALSTFALIKLAISNTTAKKEQTQLLKQQLQKEFGQKIDLQAQNFQYRIESLYEEANLVQEKMQRELNEANARADKLAEANRAEVSKRKAAERHVADAKKETQAVQKQLDAANARLNGLTKSNEVQVRKRKAAERHIAADKQEIRELEEMFEKRLESLAEQLRISDRFIDEAFVLTPEAERSLNKYSELFNRELSKEERAALRLQLEKEPWLTVFSAEERKDFLKIIDETILSTESALSREGGLYVFANRTNQYLAKHTPMSSKYLLGFGRKLLSRSGLLSVMLLAFMVAPAISAQAKSSNPKAQRIKQNPSLFLQATPDQLAEFERDPEIYDACVEAAAVLHEMTFLDEDELVEARQLVTEQNTARRHTLATAKAR